jgi:uncharacterized protein YciW
MANDNKSIIKEALVDYEIIQQAAEANAKKKLAEEFPKEFSNLLKEELNKNKKTAKESYKKLDESKESEKSDETGINKESDMKNQKEETKKVVETAGQGKPFVTKTSVPSKDVAKVNEANVEEDVKITDTVGKSDPFKGKKVAKGKDVLEEEREKDFTADVEGKTPNIGKGEAEKGKVYNEKIKGPTSGKPISNLTEEFDISELDTSSVNNALGNAGGSDEILTMESIEEEISKMQGLGEELQGINPQSPSYMESGNKGVAYNQLVEMRNKLDEMISSIGGVQEQKNNGGQGANRINPGGPTTPMIDELGEQKNNGGQGANKINPGGPTKPMIDEEQPIKPEDVEDVLGTPSEKPVEEAMQISYSAGTITPGKLGDHEGTHGRFRHQGVDESAKKLSGLINENKQLTKKINEVKKYKTSVSTLLENYKTALDKYRNQLKDMALFNTNLAHVNNLLVNEELALTQDDKIKIINEFKKVDNIADSQKKYKAVLTEMKESRKTLTESVEDKAAVSIQPSSKQKLEEVTAYADDSHMKKMRRIIEYVERKDKKIIS